VFEDPLKRLSHLKETESMRQRKFEPDQHFESPLSDDDLLVSLTIYDIPASLLRQFSQNVIKPYYPGGVSDAIKDLMRKAANEKQQAVTQTTS
jgi:hypothetical protein